MSAPVLAACLAFSNYMQLDYDELIFWRHGQYYHGMLAEVTQTTPSGFCQKNLELIDLGNGIIRNLRVLYRPYVKTCDDQAKYFISVSDCPTSFQPDKIVASLEAKYSFKVGSMTCSLPSSAISVIGLDGIARTVGINFTNYHIKSVVEENLLGSPLRIEFSTPKIAKNPCSEFLIKSEVNAKGSDNDSG